MVRALGILFSRVWEEERVSVNKIRVWFFYSSKGGRKSEQLLKNYRPISQVNTVGKFFSCILNRRLKRVCEI